MADTIISTDVNEATVSDTNHQEEHTVEVELFRRSLSNLGKTFNNARHAYLSLNLAGNNLPSVNVRISE